MSTTLTAHATVTLAAPTTMSDVLRLRAERQPDERVFTYLINGEEEGTWLTYGELDRQARMIAALLQRHTRPGARALLLYPPGLEFVAAFFGCLYAGVVAVPAYPPHPARLQRSLPRLQSIAGDAKPSVALTTAKFLDSADDIARIAPVFQTMRWLQTDELTDVSADEWRAPALDGDDLAFLQYTSGSTATPKGVMVTHHNLLANSAYIAQASRYCEMTFTPESVLVTWLPTFHDMGLIFGILQPLYSGFRCYVMPPAAFLQRPLRWLQAISRYRATHTVGPNLAFDLCAQKITAEQRATLDLTSLTSAINGAEPVRVETLERFAEAFAPCGFRRQAFVPCYGLAEATLMVTGARKPDAPLSREFQAAALEQHRVVPAGARATDTRTLVSCGHVLADTRVRIVQPDTLRRCAPDEVGEIWVAGPGVARGYWHRPDETEHTFQAYLSDTGDGPFMRTGDLGFLYEGALYVTGRIKDLIIIAGANHYPQDIELTAEQSHPALRAGCGAAFSVEVEGQERLVVAIEVERRWPKQADEGETANARAAAAEITAAVRRAVAEVHELQVHQVVLLKVGGIPKTSSGKIQRRACRAAFLAGSLVAWDDRA